MIESQIANPSHSAGSPAALAGPDIPRMLTQTLVEAMETMAFISPLPLTDVPPGNAPPLYRIYVAFSGPCSGGLEISAPGRLGGRMVSNVLANDADSPEVESQAVDALMELGNIVCGLLLRKLQCQFTTRFSLAPPKSQLEPAGGAWSVLLARPGVIALDAEGFPLLARLQLHSPDSQHNKKGAE